MSFEIQELSEQNEQEEAKQTTLLNRQYQIEGLFKVLTTFNSCQAFYSRGKCCISLNLPRCPQAHQERARGLTQSPNTLIEATLHVTYYLLQIQVSL